ncbi:MAG: saccharopine dehydrogenase NADP-binding domain-containing protein [Acidimicrobiia bacterium]|nr:saccharopine dehydrogenase NADP-binding domain-containing protein [Acidimicrobiia bacterium]
MIVVFGATGYTGRLVTAALVERGARPTLAGRHADALGTLSRHHGGLPTAVADVTDPASVQALVRAGDVLVTTVGPFSLHGRAALDAAVDAGAHYVDSTGEAGFIRHVVLDGGPRAEASGSALLTGFGYDYVPGHIAGQLALDAAGPQARQLRIVYSGLGVAISTGTRASAALMIADRVHRREASQIVERPTGRDVVDGAILTGGTEPLTAGRQWPRVSDVSVWLELGRTARIAQVASFVAPTLMRLSWLRDRAVRGATRGGPSAEERSRSTTSVTAVASDADRREIGRATVTGPNPYDLTAITMAEGALALAAGPPRAGALGPLELFAHLPLPPTMARLSLSVGQSITATYPWT